MKIKSIVSSGSLAVLLLAAQACGDANNNAELSSAAAASDGFVSIRLDLTSLTEGTPRETHVIAVLNGKDVSLRRHALVGSIVPEAANLDWAYISASKTYTLYACIDTNRDGICNEPSFSQVIKPIANIANQKVKINIQSMAKSAAAQMVLLKLPKTTDSYTIKVTTSPALKLNGKLSLSLDNADNRIYIPHPPKFLKETTLKSGVRSTVNQAVDLLDGQIPYTVIVSTCNFAQGACTQSSSMAGIKKDVEYALPALTFP